MDPSLVYAEESMPTTLNPLFARTTVDFRQQSLVFDALVFRNPITGAYESDVLEGDKDGLPTFERADGGLTIVVHLKQGIRWHDGEKLTGDDVCFTIAAMLNPLTPSPVAKGVRSTLSGCESSKDGITIRLQKALHDPMSVLDFRIVPKHAFQGTAISPDDPFSSHPIGTGPMTAVRGRREVAYKAYDNPHHHPQIRELVTVEAGDPFVTIRTLLAGDLDGAASVSARLFVDPNVAGGVLRTSPPNGFLFVALNPQRGPLADVRVRQAFDLLLDRTALQELATGPLPDSAEPVLLSGPFLPDSPCKDPGVAPRTTADRAAAKALLEAAGATLQDGRWMWNGEPITLQIGINEALVVETDDLQRLLEHQLREAGFSTTAYRVTQADWARKGVTGQLTEFDLLIGKWSHVRKPDDVRGMFHTRTKQGEGALNIFNFSDPDTDALLDQYDAARTDAEATTACQAVHARLAAQVPYLFLWTTHTYSAWRSDLAGPTGWTYDAFWNFDEWHLIDAPPPPP